MILIFQIVLASIFVLYAVHFMIRPRILKGSCIACDKSIIILTFLLSLGLVLTHIYYFVGIFLIFIIVRVVFRYYIICGILYDEIDKSIKYSLKSTRLDFRMDKNYYLIYNYDAKVKIYRITKNLCIVTHSKTHIKKIRLARKNFYKSLLIK